MPRTRCIRRQFLETLNGAPPKRFNLENEVMDEKIRIAIGKLNKENDYSSI